MCSSYDDPSQYDLKLNFHEIVRRAVAQLLELLEEQSFSKIVIERPHPISTSWAWFAFAILENGKPYEIAIYFDDEGRMEADGY